MHYLQIGDYITKGKINPREFRGPRGRLIMIAVGGRLPAIAFSGVDESFFWGNPKLSDVEQLRRDPGAVRNGVGGERLWLGPEYAFNWIGVPEGREFKNCAVQRAYESGRYDWEDAGNGTLGLRMRAELEDRRRLRFSVHRWASWALLPVDLSDLRLAYGLGVCSQRLIQIESGPAHARVDLWHILQMPAGSQLLIPTNGPARRCTPPSSGQPVMCGGLAVQFAPWTAQCRRSRPRQRPAASGASMGRIRIWRT